MAKTEIVASKEPSFSSALTTTLNEVRGALPSDFNVTRFVQNGVALLNENDQLRDFAKKYGTAQIKQGMMRAAYLGLDFMDKQVYLIPFQNKLNFMIDYRGSVKLVKKYSTRPVKDVYAKLIREGDLFEEEVKDGTPTFYFKPKSLNDGQIVGAFGVILYEDGGMSYDVMTRKEIEVTRSKSKASNSMAWKDFYSQMALKTVLHRLCKTVSLDFDANQRSIYEEDVAIETDIKEIAKQEIAENANKVEFVDADVVEETGNDEVPANADYEPAPFIEGEK